MRSGITAMARAARRSTPSMWMVEVPAPAICAPILVRHSARSTISGSRAAFSMTVSPLASDAAIMATWVAPTVTFGKYDAVADEAVLRRRGDDVAAVDVDLGAERLRAPSMKKSTGRVPMAQPPGSDTLASPMRASSGPITQKLARIRETRS